MTSTPTQAPIQAAAPDIARRVALALAGLAAVVARRFLRDPQFQALIVPLWTRITRTSARFERLMARLAADRLRKPRPPQPRRATPAAVRPPALPAGHAWLIRALGHEAAAYASQLEALLAEPATISLLAACPAAARILRPLGRMLGITALAPKRVRPKRPESSPETRNRPPPTRLPPPFPRHPPNADWPHRPSADWASACRRRRSKPA